MSKIIEMVLILRKTETIYRRSFNSRFVVHPDGQTVAFRVIFPSLIQTVLK